jgi:hypothetical protein
MMSEWITDRLPELEDANSVGQVWHTDDIGLVAAMWFGFVNPGEPWMPLTNTPEPYVKPEPKRWKPKTDQSYWAVEHTGVILLQWTCNNSDLSYFYSGNCFQTEAQAQEAASRVHETLLNYHKELPDNNSAAD